MDDNLRRMGLDKTRARKGAVRPKVTGEDVRRLLADVAIGVGVPFIDAASQAAQGNYGQAAVSGLLDAPPVKMAGMALAPLIGMVRKAAPMDEALRIAQKNAAKPVSEGGLGLPPDNTPMDRARAMNAMNVFHGSPETKIKEFQDFLNPIFTTKEKSYAKVYAEKKGTKGKVYDLQMIVPNGIFDSRNLEHLRIFNEDFLPKVNEWNKKLQKPLTKPLSAGENVSFVDADQFYRFLKSKENNLPFSVIPVSEGGFGKEFSSKTNADVSYIPLSASQLRLNNAAFDPFRVNEKDLLASLAALGIGVPVMRGLLQEEEMQ